MFAFLGCLVLGCNLLPVHTAGKGSSPCVFPFVFDGKSYSSCTKDGAIDEQLWCGTTANYDKDGQWKHCSLQEHGGNSGGKPCIFPFVYKNRTFYTCTEEEKGRFWCATTRNYDRDLQWSYCADTRLDANPKGPCVFPFVYNRTSYSSCTTDGISNRKPWCSLTNNYDTDLQWTYCEPSGPDESVESLSCVFPFIYKGKLYFSCTADGRSDGRLWCATSSIYAGDKKRKFCQENSGPVPMVESPFCVFPFIYKGISYRTCISEGMSDGKLWCANTSNYDIDKKWVYCNVTEPDASPKDLCTFPFIYNSKVYLSCTTDGMSGQKPWCSLTKHYNTDLQWTYCEPSGPDEVMESPPCVFPFIFKRKFYHSCTTDGQRDEKPWCSTTVNYDADQKQKFCPKVSGPDPKVESPSCVFPFIFKGMSHSTCTAEGMSDGESWCATSSNYDMDKKWIYCNVTGPDENMESTPCVFPFIYKGKFYPSCTADGRSDGRLWCATTSNYENDKKWKFCQDSGPDPNGESPSCVFPFIYKGRSYSACTTEGMSNGKCWCATTNNYDINKKWMYCNDTGPDESVESPPCVFPFIFDDKFYLSCTADGRSDGRLWCATTSSYDADKKWKFCQEDSGPDPKVESPSCVFPFIFKGTSYSACTTEGMRDGKPWCAISSNYDVDKKWMYCNVTETGPETSQEAPRCVFPFIFKGKNYSSCTEDGRRDGKLWCSTTANYDTDKKLMLCTVTKTGCVFPFVYKGKSYERCTTLDYHEGKSWCATTADDQTGLKWRLCNQTDCVFPFIFRGKSYHSCTRAGHADRKHWCSLTGNADIDKSWLLC